MAFIFLLKFFIMKVYQSIGYRLAMLSWLLTAGCIAVSIVNESAMWPINGLLSIIFMLIGLIGAAKYQALKQLISVHPQSGIGKKRMNTFLKWEFLMISGYGLLGYLFLAMAIHRTFIEKQPVFG